MADWDDVVFVHFAIESAVLQPLVPFELDRFAGRAYVSLVAFTQRRLRPRMGGKIAAFLSGPLASHEFLNVRTYVQHGDERGIYFLAEWIPNRLAALIGPPLYGLPYRLGRLRYQYDRAIFRARHEIFAGQRLEFDAEAAPDCNLRPVPGGSLDEFLLERYVAFTRCGEKSMCFRVQHSPWDQKPVQIRIGCSDLLARTGLDIASMELVGGNYSPSLKDVGLGAPTRVEDCGIRSQAIKGRS
jgi:hypothetical protein